MIALVLTALRAAALAACFAAPQPVVIDGWRADAMEPFISRDGALLFFNSSNAPDAKTDLYWARRISDLHFKLVGPVPGANSSALNGVPSHSRDGAFAFISPRDYDARHGTIWTGHWTGAAVTGLELQPQLAPPAPGWFNMDAEISADGRRLYFTDNLWAASGPPKVSTFHLARLTASGWRADPAADAWFAAINTGGLQYAAGLSADERALFFTRLTVSGPGSPSLRIMVATRPDLTQPFSAPAPIPVISGFAEAPTVAQDGAIYFHQKRDGRFTIMRSANTCRR